MFYLIVLATIFGFNPGDKSGPYFHEVEVLPGEGVISLLRRYDLHTHPCNQEQFYVLNDLEAGASLHRGREYKIPVLIYDYNGKSIRSSIGDNDWDKAVRIQQYNERILSKGLRSTHYRDSKILWVPYHEVYCSGENVAKAPAEAKAVSASTSSDQVIFSLFGPAHEKVTIEDRSLEGEVYYIVAGHGGPDPGAIAEGVANRYTLCEDEYAYDVSLRLAKELLKKGANVHMIVEDRDDGIRDDAYLECDYDETCNGKSIPRNQIKRLKQRANRVNELYHEYKKKGAKKQRVICIHVDSQGEHKRQDVFFYYYGKSKTGKSIAQNLHQTFNEKYKKYQAHRGYHGTLSSRPLYMLRKTDAPAVYVELANIRNAEDRRRIVHKDNREAVAKWLAEGLVK